MPDITAVVCPSCQSKDGLRVEAEAVIVRDVIGVQEGLLVVKDSERVSELEGWTLTCIDCGHDADLVDFGVQRWGTEVELSEPMPLSQALVSGASLADKRGCSCGQDDYGAPGHDGGPRVDLQPRHAVNRPARLPESMQGRTGDPLGDYLEQKGETRRGPL